jgi:ligand-binding sensor domain-containing protein/serine phosphatase RsbU (regulator of sigma subunit)
MNQVPFSLCANKLNMELQIRIQYKARMMKLITLCILSYFMIFTERLFAQQYNFDSYTIKNGLIQSNVTSIVQDKEGYLWFGTEAGISKFNGRNFTGFSVANGLAESGVQRILIDKKGRIWIAHTLGKLSVFENNSFREINLPAQLGIGRIVGIFNDQQGFIWLCTIEKGAIRMNPDNPNESTSYGLKEGLDDDVYSGIQSSSGLIWFVTSIGIKTFNPKTSTFEFFKPEGVPFYKYTCINEDKEGNYWFGTYNHGVMKYNSITKKHVIYDRVDGLPSSFVTCIINRSDSSIAVGTWKTDEINGGLALIKKNQIINIDRNKGLPGEKVSCLFEDIEGNLWIGFKNRGIAQFGGNNVKHFGKKDGIGNDVVNCILTENDDKAWIGTDGGITIIETEKNGKIGIRNIETNSLLGSNQITDIEDLGDRLAFSSFIGRIGLFNKNNMELSELLELNKDYVNCLELDEQNKLWIGSVNGLTIYDLNSKKYKVVEALEDKIVMTIKFDGLKDIWIGTRESGLYFGESINSIKKVTDFPHRSPTSILVGNDKKIWFGTEGGGLYSKEKNGGFVPSSKLNEKAKFISGIMESGEKLIIGTSIGFFELVNNKIELHDESDGFIYPEIMLNSMFHDRQGNYWFGTNNGITVFTDYHKANKQEGPKVILESFRVFSRIINRTDNISLSYQENDVRISFTALTYTLKGKVRYRYKLEGIDKDFQEETNLNSAHYTNLSPGKYNFLVYAKNANGVWSKEPAKIKFEIVPPFWKTYWFIVMVGIISASGIWLYVFIRTKNLKRTRVQLEKQVKERTQEIVLKNQNLLDANKTISNKNKEITDSINYAKRIQESVLPNISDLRDHFPQSFIIYKPKDIVSGDFYWFKEEESSEGKKGRIFIAVADCTGHGVPGAFMCMIGSSLLYQILQENPGIKPAGMLHLLDKGIKYLLKQNENETRDGMDIAICAYDSDKQTIEFSGAMRPLYLLRKEDNGGHSFQELKPEKESIGGLVTNNFKIFENHTINVQSGDSIYFSTDGFADQFGGKLGKKLMSKKFKELLVNTVSDSMNVQEQKIRDYWREWSDGYEQIDDVLVIGLRIDIKNED